MAALRPIAREVVPHRGPRRREHPRRGRRAGRLQPLRHRPGRRPDDDGRRSTTTTGRFLRPLGADLVFRLPFVSEHGPQGRRHPGLQRGRRADARAAASWSASGPRASRASASRSPSATSSSGSAAAASSSAALRTGVPIVPLSVVGAEEIYPLVGNVPSLARLLGVPYIPITPFFPLARAARPGAAAVEVADRVRRADPHRRATTPARPTTRCWSSTSPTRCARRSSRRSTRC